jgi:4-diphosphocytidyl-2-C-methyl-D-erythritol kinase
LIIEAPAKINLTLEITGVDENGYHTLDTLFVWLDLHDSLELRRAETTALEIEAQGVDIALVTSDEDNLVLRALRALESFCGRKLPTHLSLTKRIPAGGGLGGGSADAAAALLGLRDLHDLSVDDADLHGLAAKLGADVAFGLRGGFARGRHYGDELQSLPLPTELSGRSLVLVAPGFACPTPEVYRCWDQSPSRQAAGATDRLLEALPGQRLREVQNDLEPAAQRLFPRLAQIKQEMLSSGLEGVCLSGSGSTMFGFVPRKGSPDQFQKDLQGLGKVLVTQLREDRRGE